MSYDAVLSKQRLELEGRALPLWQLRAIRRGLIRTCINCEYWMPNKSAGAQEGCIKAGGALPPANVIVLGCDGWEENIPF